VSDRNRFRASICTLLLTAIVAGCGGAAAATPTATRAPTPTPTPAGGIHQFTVGNPPIELTMTLPPGWQGDASSASRSAAEGGQLSVSAWVLSAVYADPCQWRSSAQQVGPSTDAVVAALMGQAHRQSRVATVKIGDLVAQRVFMTVSSSEDFASCDEGAFRGWIGAPAGVEMAPSAPGQTDEAYVIDVGGVAVVLDAAYGDATTDELAEIHRIIQSLQVPVQESAAPSPG